jgi:hypothetical protein
MIPDTAPRPESGPSGLPRPASRARLGRGPTSFAGGAMKFGLTMFPTHDAIDPVSLAQAAEELIS